MNVRAERAVVLEALRDEIAKFFLRAILLVIGAVMVLGLWRAWHAGTLAVQLAISAIYLVVVAIYLAQKRIPPRVQLSVCIAAGIATGLAVFSVFALLGNGVMYLIGSCAITALLFGRAQGWAAVAGCSVALLVPFAMWRNGLQVTDFKPQEFFDDPRSWVSAVTTFTGIAAVLILVTGRITRQLLASEGEEGAMSGKLATELAELERAEQDLRSEEARYASAFASSPDAMTIWDRDKGTIAEANDALLLLARVAREALVDRPVGELWRLLGAERELAVLEASFANGSVVDLPLRLARRSGVDREFLCNAAEFESGGTAFAMLVMRDVSTQRAGERSLERLTEELESAVAERTAALHEATREFESFAYSVAHNLRTPLRAMNAYAEILIQERGAAIGPAAGRLAARIRALALGMGSQVDALLELSRINRREIRREEVDLSAMAAEVVAQLRAGSPLQDAEVRIEPQLRAQADPALARLILGNLLGNAWKFSARAGRPLIEFGCVRESGHDAFYVRDNGVGFDMAYAAKLFEPFERLHAPGEFEGAGIGLASVARAVQRHGGRVWAESSPGRGATFWFVLGLGGKTGPLPH